MEAKKKMIQDLQTNYLRLLGASDVEILEPGDEVIVIARFEAQFTIHSYDIDTLEQLIGIRPEIGFDNSGSDAGTVDMVYSYPASCGRGNVI